MSPARLWSTGWWLLAVTIWLLAGLSAAQAQTKPGAKPAMPPLFLEDASPMPLVPTIRAFEEAVRAQGWSMLGVTNMAGILSERGYTIAPVLIFEPCSGKYSADLLGRDETRFVASMIPCRVAIYQTSTGKVIISRINSAAMGDMVGGHAGSVIRKAGEEMELIIRATLKKLAK
jgi:uncharacterized protein (DUF302 family)